LRNYVNNKAVGKIRDPYAMKNQNRFQLAALAAALVVLAATAFGQQPPDKVASDMAADTASGTYALKT
jgi:hypothetical protein